LLIGEAAKDHYCIMLDADTVSVADVPEVVDAISANRSFTLGTWKNQSVVSIEQVCASVASNPSKHVQVHSERNLGRLPNAQRLKYVRGCGGFAGFRSGNAFRTEIEYFSGAMDAILGRNKWAEWGSQQVASNYFVANSEDAIVLPFPKYASYGPSVDPDDCAFIHFIGSYRFVGGTYACVAKHVIRSL
jgi:hypothetical protein